MLEEQDQAQVSRFRSLRGGLGRRILMWFLALSLLPLFLSNSVGYTFSRRIIEDHVHRYLGALGQIQTDHVAHAVERHQLFLEMIASGNPHVSGYLRIASDALAGDGESENAPEALREILHAGLADLPSLTELFVLDRDGRLVEGTGPDPFGTDFSNASFFRVALEGSFFAGEWPDEDASQRPAFRFATPIRDEQNQVVGVLAATVGASEQNSFLLMTEHVAEHVETFIVCRGGRPLFVSHAHRPIDYAERLASPLVDMPPGSQATYVNYAGEEVIGVSLPIRGVPWVYIAEEPVESAFGELRGLRLLSATLEGLFALLLVGIVWLVAGSIVKPVGRLVEAAHRIQEGDLDAQVEVERPDELGELSYTFNQMAHGLKESAAQIQDLHDQDMRRAAQLASVGELAAGVAHEIKNPLAGASSGIELLEQKLDRGEPTDGIVLQVRDQLSRIERAVRDLLSYARPKEPRVGWVIPRLLVDRVIALVKPQAEAAGVTIKQEADTETDRVRVDPELLSQALVNLALNGIQAMSPGGVLTIRTDQVRGAIRIAVSDTGKGIPDDDLQRIFRPFFTTRHRGTGLGLAITRAIVERHGGRVEVESTPGQGSSFILVLLTAGKESAA
jgi:signal transduction histidine kinase